MGQYFDDYHANAESQFFGTPHNIEDSPEISEKRKAATDAKGHLELGEALCRQLRYRESLEEFSLYIAENPDDMQGYRKRGPRYLNTLQFERAKEDFLHCKAMGGEPHDVDYRIGLCEYMLGNYETARSIMVETFPHCNDEMGVACIYWHSLCSYRLGLTPTLMDKWHEDMDVGHHTAYQLCARVFSGTLSMETGLELLSSEEDDMEYATAMYGLCGLLLHCGRRSEYDMYTKRILERDGFWPCFAYIAAWIDLKGRP